MPEFYYGEALKRGKKEYRACIARGASPFLPVMDDFIPEERSMSAIDLGVVQIPSEFIVGTKSRSRENTFAANFMPLLEPGAEFSAKWQNLCNAHLEEGIQEPIKAFEFMNRFYVQEGNKRVSVLKFFDSPQVAGRVLRILPERSADTELYYEFLDFYRLSRINFIEFSYPGSYASLQRLVGKLPEETWTEEERRGFSTAYVFFRQAYESRGGGDLRETPGDAMLAYMEIYGYPALRGRSAQVIRDSLSKVWEEIVLRQERDPIDVKLDPEEKKPGIIQKVLGGESKRTKVGFVHDGNPLSSAWARGHERGREYVQRVLDGQIQTVSYFDALVDTPERLIDRAIDDGCTVIFTTSPRLVTASLRAAVEHPEVMIFNCSLNTSHRYIRTYYARMYEVKFIIGALAGAMAGENPVGYLADYPIFGQIAGVNAFALGAQMVNPRTRVYLEWSTVGGADRALNRLTDRGIRLISSQDLVRLGKEGSSSLGLSLISEGARLNLATPLWQWGSYYEQILRLIRSKSIQSEYSQSSRALNYYWGLSAGVVELRCSDSLPPSVKKLASTLQESIRRGDCEPFCGPIYAQSGQVLGEGNALSPDQIIGMDYLVENVVGRIPDYEELTEIGKATADMMGVFRPRGSVGG